jgi:hypothetical protein
MNRRLLAIVVPLLAVILFHDSSMAVFGHPAATTSSASAEHAGHEHNAPAPDACETVRVQYLRLPDPEVPAGSDVRPSPAPVPLGWSDSAISDTYLIVPVLPPPSACLALFQAFLI